MRLLRVIFCGMVSLALTGAFGDSAFAADAKKKKKVMKKKTTTETTTETTAPASAAPSTSTETTVTKHTESSSGYKPAYGAAGCGLGSIVIGNKPGIIQVVAATFNGTAGSQTFGITTGTSNCKEGSAESAQVEREVFVDMNLASLSKEAAQGSGEHLAAFADILGCAQESGDLAAFGKLSQEQYSQIFAGSNAKSVAANYVNAVKANPRLASKCVRAS